MSDKLTPRAIDTESLTPAQTRQLFRRNGLVRTTAGLCPGFAQCNLIILPDDVAGDFAGFAEKNPLACPVLEMTSPGQRQLKRIARDSDVARDFPKYRIYENGVLTGEPLDVSHLWRDDLVSFMIGCSFSFEDALLKAGIPVRHIEQNCNVPMYITDIDCVPNGMFSGKMVVSMRPMTPLQAELAAEITSRMPRVHGAPVHIGDGRAIGVNDVMRPDFGDAVTVKPGEACVFWPCGVTPQSVVMNARPPFAITHAPGHMFICDIENESLIDRGDGENNK